MTFTPEAIADLRRELATISTKSDALLLAFTAAEYDTEAGKELAQQGFTRRVLTLARSLQNVFSFIPPDHPRMPTNDERRDAEINIQASILSAIAATDNLAGIWVHERRIMRNNGQPLPPTWIGLRAENRDIRRSFGPEFRTYLESRDDWFEAIGDIRDALAHRIPLYIPPFVLTHANEAAYMNLERRMSATGDCEEYERLKAEQMQLVVFRAWMQHSFVEEGQPVVFHSQLLANFNTIDEMGHKFLEELARVRGQDQLEYGAA
jgi:hypothetical protein